MKKKKETMITEPLIDTNFISDVNTENQLRIYNGFGITPTNTYVSAGMDFYVPNIISDEQKERALKAFEKSFGINKDFYVAFGKAFYDIMVRSSNARRDLLEKNLVNIIHLFLGLYNKELETYKNDDFYKAVKLFCDEYLIWNKEIPGIKIRFNDTVLFNSGIKVNLPHDYAGIFFNKSGMGNRGWDTRACVVDEDYSGYCHLSMAFTKNAYEIKDMCIFCGDKLSQMVILPIKHMQPIEVSEDEYDYLMSGTNRGDKAFGSSDVKHDQMITENA